MCELKKEYTSLKDKTLSLFNNAYDATPHRTTVGEFLKSVSEPNPLVDQIRATDGDEKKALKRKLPRVGVNNIFSGGKSASHIVNGTWILEIELDAKDNDCDLPRWLDTIKPQIKEVFPACLAAFKTASGKGIAFWVHIDPHKREDSFYTLEQDFKRANLKVDSSTINSTYYRATTYDPDIYINLEAPQFEPWLKKPKKKLSSRKTTTPDDPRLKFVLNQIVERGVDITEDNENWTKLKYSLANGLGEEGREVFHTVSQFHPKYKERETDYQFTRALKTSNRGNSMGTFYATCKQYGIDISSTGELEIYTPDYDQTINLSPDQYLSDVDLDVHQNTFIVGGCGIGKTTWSSKVLPQIAREKFGKHTKVVIAVPTQAIARQQAEDNNLHYVAKSRMPNNDPVQICVYDSLVKFDPSNTVTVIDEAHVLVEGARYRSKVAIDGLLEFSRECLQVIAMTATEIYNEIPELQGFTKIKVTKAKTKDTIIPVQYAENGRRASFERRLKRGEKNLVLFNTKKERLNDEAEYFRRKGWKVAVLHSDNKDSDDYKYLMQTGRIKKDVEIVLATNLISLGVNIRNQIDSFHIVSRESVENAYQLTQRERSDRGRTVYVYVSEKDFKSKFSYNVTDAYRQKLEQAQRVVEEDKLLHTLRELGKTDTADEVMRALTKSNLWIMRGGKMVVNHTGIALEVNEEKRDACYKNFELFKAYYQQYNFKVSDIERDDTQEHAVNKSIMRSIRIESKKARDEKYKDFLSQMTDFEEEVEGGDGYLNEIRKRINALGHYLTFEDAKSAMLETGDNRSAWGRLMDQLRYKTYKESMNIETKETRAIDNIKAQFEVGEVYTSEEIRERLRAGSTESAKLEHQEYNGRRAITALQMFFTVERTSRKIGEDESGRMIKENVYKIVDDTPVKYPLKSQRRAEEPDEVPFETNYSQSELFFIRKTKPITSTKPKTQLPVQMELGGVPSQVPCQ